MREICTSGSTRGQWVAGQPVAHCPTLLAHTVLPRGRPAAYSIAMAAVFEATPPMVKTTFTAGPPAACCGTSTFTWYKPTKPGARPAKETVAFRPPIVTVAGVKVVARGLLGEGLPSPGRFLTSPRPVQYKEMDSPFFAGREPGNAPERAAKEAVPEINAEA